MSIQKSIGKNTLGGGSKMKVDLRTYNRSTHDLSYAWRSTMAVGTLVPCMKILGLPGDTFDINIDSKILTHPTVGPLFGSFKFQVDIFTCPIRLYNAMLHNNTLNIGMKMSDVKFPITCAVISSENEIAKFESGERRTFNGSCLLNYLGVKGVSSSDVVTESNVKRARKEFNAIPLLAYWDIFKNYYANKQEEKYYQIEFKSSTTNPPVAAKLALKAYNLNSLDTLRENILAKGRAQIRIGDNAIQTPNFNIKVEQSAWMASSYLETTGESNSGKPAVYWPQVGLLVKTHQSDIFNNWVNDETIDGTTNGITAITSIDTSEGSFTIDQLNLAKKVYDMLNRIAISGGSYQDWIETVYTSDFEIHAETPIYEGGMSDEIEFDAVVSNSATTDEPLGTLAGRGFNGSRKKGGKLHIKVKEPCYIIGIASITPRVDYSQGNDWDIELRTMDDLHKPALDGIGFQDLMCQQLAHWTENNFAIGKQPAWINYMTNFNKTYGNFAAGGNEAFMCLNRIYEGSAAKKDRDTQLTNASTYINPTMYNYIFAETSLEAQNFWTQIGFGIQARRVMSAKQIPSF